LQQQTASAKKVENDATTISDKASALSFILIPFNVKKGSFFNYITRWTLRATKIIESIIRLIL